MPPAASRCSRRQEALQAAGIDELVDAERVRILDRRAELLALRAAEQLQLAHALHLQLEQALVLRRASLRTRRDGPGRAEGRGKLRKPRAGRRALFGGRAGRDEDCKAREGAEDGRPHGALPVAERGTAARNHSGSKARDRGRGSIFQCLPARDWLGALRGSCRGRQIGYWWRQSETPIENKRARPARNGTARPGERPCCSSCPI